jgi:hypothetical protein
MDLDPDANPYPNQVSGVASVTGFEGDAAHASSADAVLASVVDQLVAHSAKVANPNPNLALTLKPHLTLTLTLALALALTLILNPKPSPSP